MLHNRVPALGKAVCLQSLTRCVIPTPARSPVPENLQETVDGPQKNTGNALRAMSRARPHTNHTARPCTSSWCLHVLESTYKHQNKLKICRHQASDLTTAGLQNHCLPMYIEPKQRKIQTKKAPHATFVNACWHGCCTIGCSQHIGPTQQTFADTNVNERMVSDDLPLATWLRF